MVHVMRKHITFFILNLCLVLTSLQAAIAMEQKDPIHQNFIKGRLSSTRDGDVDFPARWESMKFDKFEGDRVLIGDTGEPPRISVGNFDHLVIPEDGVYSLTICYNVYAAGSMPGNQFASIAINDFQHADDFSKRYHVEHGETISDIINYVTRLRRGDKIMLAIKGWPQARYNSSYNWLQVEKLSIN